MYVDEHPDSTNGRYEYIDQTQETIVKQVTAGMLPEASVIVTVGFDLGEVKDNRVDPLFRSNSRSAVAIQACFNQFTQREQPLRARLSLNTVKQPARAHFLPFADLFAWFKKTSENNPAARMLLKKYRSKAIGHPNPRRNADVRDEYFCQQLCQKNAFRNSRRITQAVEENIDVPILATYNDAGQNSEAAVVSCFHPGHLSHMSILKGKAEGLLAMMLSVAWHASYLAVKFAISQSMSESSSLDTFPTHRQEIVNVNLDTLQIIK